MSGLRMPVAYLATAIICFGLCLPTAADDKYALLIGVTKYQHSDLNRPPLRFPEADAKAVERLLKASGYTIELLVGKQATRAAITDALARTSRQGGTDGVVVIGLFGHGVQYGQDAYFCPFDTTIRAVVDAGGAAIRDSEGVPLREPDPESLVSLRMVLDALTVCGAGNRVILADCCRSDPGIARGRAFGSDLKVSDLPAGTAALFACSENEEAFEHDDWGHGAFTRAILDYASGLKDGSDTTANTLSAAAYRGVNKLVNNLTNGRSRQTVNPIINGVVDLHLVRAEGSGALSATPARPGALRKLELATGITLRFRYCPISSIADVQGRGSVIDHSEQSSSASSRGVWIGESEVRQAEWHALMSTPPSYFSPQGDGRGKIAGLETSALPAENISWYDAVAFCNAVSEAAELPPYYRLADVVREDGSIVQATVERLETTGVRLPTSREWQAAASMIDPTLAIGDIAWHQQNADFRTHRCAELLANSLGIFDLLGNVAEWSDDTDAGNPSHVLVFGASWIDAANRCRPDRFATSPPRRRLNTYGLRLAISE